MNASPALNKDFVSTEKRTVFLILLPSPSLPHHWVHANHMSAQRNTLSRTWPRHSDPSHSTWTQYSGYQYAYSIKDIDSQVMLQSCAHIHIYAQGYSRWKPIGPEDMEIMKMPGILLPDIHSEEMPYGCYGFFCRDLLMPDAMDVALADRRSWGMNDGRYRID
jgi:hypothetical protein